MNIQPVLQSLKRAFVSQFDGKMLALLFMPFLLSIIVWAILAYFVWEPFTMWLAQSSLIKTVFGSWLGQGSVDLPGAGQMAAAKVLGFLLLLPAIFGSAVVAITVLAMPVVTRHLSAKDYPDVKRQGSLAIHLSLANSLKALAIFLVGYLVTIPLWFIPPLFLVVPWLWWGWLTSRLMRFDSLVEHASAMERNNLIQRNKFSYWALGLAIAAFNFVPPLFLLAPVFGALAFSHFSLNSLRESRGLQ